jgi:hypothetical protein
MVRELQNRPGVTFDEDNLHTLFAEDWNEAILLLQSAQRSRDIWPVLQGALFTIPAVSTRYTVPFSSLVLNSPTGFQFIPLKPGKIKLMSIFRPTAQPSTGQFVAILYINGTPTASSFTQAPLSASGFYMTSALDIEFSAGDKIHFFLRNYSSSNITFSNLNLFVDYDPD